MQFDNSCTKINVIFITDGDDTQNDNFNDLFEHTIDSINLNHITNNIIDFYILGIGCAFPINISHQIKKKFHNGKINNNSFYHVEFPTNKYDLIEKLNSIFLSICTLCWTKIISNVSLYKNFTDLHCEFINMDDYIIVKNLTLLSSIDINNITYLIDSNVHVDPTDLNNILKILITQLKIKSLNNQNIKLFNSHVDDFKHLLLNKSINEKSIWKFDIMPILENIKLNHNDHDNQYNQNDYNLNWTLKKLYIEKNNLMDEHSHIKLIDFLSVVNNLRINILTKPTPKPKPNQTYAITNMFEKTLLKQNFYQTIQVESNDLIRIMNSLFNLFEKITIEQDKQIPIILNSSLKPIIQTDFFQMTCDFFLGDSHINCIIKSIIKILNDDTFDLNCTSNLTKLANTFKQYQTQKNIKLFWWNFQPIIMKDFNLSICIVLATFKLVDHIRLAMIIKIFDKNYSNEYFNIIKNFKQIICSSV